MMTRSNWNANCLNGRDPDLLLSMLPTCKVDARSRWSATVPIRTATEAQERLSEATQTTVNHRVLLDGEGEDGQDSGAVSPTATAVFLVDWKKSAPGVV